MKGAGRMISLAGRPLRSQLLRAFTPDDDLARAPSKRLPVVIAIDGLDAKACRQEKQLQFAWKENVHIESGEVALVLARGEKLLVCPGNMLQLLEGIVSAAGIDQHGEFVVGGVDLIFHVDV